MLSYAFKILNSQGYKSVETEEYDNVVDLCSEILIRGMNNQIKRGLLKQYKSEKEETAFIKGRINISDSIRNNSFVKRKLVCEYDDFSVDNQMNQTIKATLFFLLRGNISRDRKKEIKKILVYLKDVSLISIYDIEWKMKFNKNNQTYRMLISICYLVLNGLLQTTNDGQTKLMDFIDEKRLFDLYEKFLLEYYKKEHKELSVKASQIAWWLDDGNDAMLPNMYSDIMLESKNSILIIDAKYYEKTMQGRFAKKTMHSSNLYQIFAYVKNKTLDSSKDVSGMLLYAKTDEEITPDNSYSMSGNMIHIKTLDLNKEFSLIKDDLDAIAKKLY